MKPFLGEPCTGLTPERPLLGVRDPEPRDSCVICAAILGFGGDIPVLQKYPAHRHAPSVGNILRAATKVILESARTQEFCNTGNLVRVSPIRVVPI